LGLLTPIVAGLVLGVPGVIGLLVGALTCGFCLAVFMANAGGSWDNAKKYIEGGAHGGKGTDAHKAAVVGDTVGDPFKDTSGPSLNILIKLMSMVSVVAAGLIVRFGMTGTGFAMAGSIIGAAIIAWGMWSFMKRSKKAPSEPAAAKPAPETDAAPEADANRPAAPRSRECGQPRRRFERNGLAVDENLVRVARGGCESGHLEHAGVVPLPLRPHLRG
jgi:hypothetical protein